MHQIILGGIMNFLKIFISIIAASVLVFSCKPGEKEMTPENFLKIDTEILSTDLTLESKEAVAKKYGYTLKQYNDFEEKVEKDPALKTKIGEIRLGQQKKDGSKK
jgi:hypothetical protein